MSNDSHLQKVDAVTVSEAPLSTITVQQQQQQEEHPQSQTQPIPGSVSPADDSGSANAPQQPSQPQTQTQQHVIYAPTPHPPRRASHHEPPRRRPLSPKLVVDDDYPSLTLAATERLGRIPSSTHSLPPPRERSGEQRDRAHHNDQRQRSRSSDNERHPIPVHDTTSWIVPAEKRQRREMTIGERLQPTIDAATNERDKAVKRAKMTGYSLNVAIAVQVLLGALTTGLGAALSGKSTSIAISILGGASTLAASYLARARGSNEPEFSLLRARALNQFLREIHAFKLDHGHKIGHTFDDRIDGYRFGLENILGNAISASVGTIEDMGPRRDGPGGPAALGLGGGAHAGIGMSTGFGANLNGVPQGNSGGVGLAISPQQQQQSVQHQGKAVQGATGPAIGGNVPPPFSATQQTQGVGTKTSLAHSMV